MSSHNLAAQKKVFHRNMKKFLTGTNRAIFIKTFVSFLMLSLFQLWTVAFAVAQSGESIRIATFNIQVFGVKKAESEKTMRTLAKIIRKYDIVAVQEIKNKAGTVPFKFLTYINKDGAAYDFLLSKRTGRKTSSKEQYAYYFNTATIEVLDKGGLYDDSLSDHFERDPFVSRFRTFKGNFTFVLLSIHTPPKSAVSEIAALEYVIEWARGRYPQEDDFIVLGDFNAGCEYASEQELRALSFSNSPYNWIIPHSADTNVANSRCAYDRIVITSGTNEDYNKKWGVDRAFTEKKISDHWPVWAEFFVDQDTGVNR